MLGAKGCHSTIPQGSSKTDVLAVFCCGQSLTKQTAKKRLKAVLRVLSHSREVTWVMAGFMKQVSHNPLDFVQGLFDKYHCLYSRYC